jgi:hypothetical protein
MAVSHRGAWSLLPDELWCVILAFSDECATWTQVCRAFHSMQRRSVFWSMLYQVRVPWCHRIMLLHPAGNTEWDIPLDTHQASQCRTQLRELTQHRWPTRAHLYVHLTELSTDSWVFPILQSRWWRKSTLISSLLPEDRRRNQPSHYEPWSAYLDPVPYDWCRGILQLQSQVQRLRACHTWVRLESNDYRIAFQQMVEDHLTEEEALFISLKQYLSYYYQQVRVRAFRDYVHLCEDIMPRHNM